MKKSILALTLTLAALLTACGAKETPAPAPEAAPPAVEEPAKAPETPETPEETPKAPAEEPAELPAEQAEPEETEAPQEAPYAVILVEGLVEDAIGYALEQPVFDGLTAQEAINQFYADLVNHLESYTRDTVYLQVMEQQTVASVYGQIRSAQLVGQELQVEYAFLVETAAGTQESVRTDVFSVETGEVTTKTES